MFEIQRLPGPDFPEDVFVDNICDLYNHPEVLPFISRTLVPFLRSTVAQWVSNRKNDGVRYFGCPVRGRLVAMTLTKKCPVMGLEIMGVMVHPDFHGNGLAKNLIGHVVDLGRAEGFHSVEISVYAVNKRMLRLVIGMDFIPVGMTYRARADGVDMVHFKRYLS